MVKENADLAKSNNLKKRIITGVFYVAIMAGTFLLRQFVDYRLFHLLTYLIVFIGAYELVRMLSPFTEKWIGVMAISEAALSVPVFMLFEYKIGRYMGMVGYVGIVAVCLITLCVYSIIKSEDLKQFGINVLHVLYPSVCLLFMCLANEHKLGFIMLFTAFVVSPLSDTMAYFTGMAFGKRKLAPKISPKKTWEGAIGGTVFGGLGAMLVYLVFKPRLNSTVPALIFLIVGLVASVVNIFGDLFESKIKRKANFKDSGGLFPGHGGMLDRFDGTMFAIIPIYLVFLLV